MGWNILAMIGALIWLGLLLLPWRPWAVRETLEAAPPGSGGDLSEVTAVIPARNEAAVIVASLKALLSQGSGLGVILVDDRCTDDTAELARRVGDPRVRIISGEPLPPGWSGKLWALTQGVRHVRTPLTLLLDADIQLAPGTLKALLQKMADENIVFISLMAHLRMSGFWECLLMPAFVFFFKLVYSFGLSNAGHPRIAAAAGGCILLRSELIEAVGGFAAFRSELIDDCALAGRVRAVGGRTWIGLTRSARSLRAYGRLGEIWNLVARTAFCQLHYSPAWLALTTLAMVLAFWLPVAGLFFPTAAARVISAVALGAMGGSYFPTLRYYGLAGFWGVLLPLIGTLFLAMTWTSAVRFWTGKGTRWKSRCYPGAVGSQGGRP
jgi:hopene-associated glycosyltransferase HpnB